MTIDVKAVKDVLSNNGELKFSNNKIVSPNNRESVKEPGIYGVIDSFRMAKATIGKSVISLVGTTTDDPHANAINIVYEGDYAAMGSIGAPSLIYSDSFSGCVFYLFSGPMGYVHAVHASRSGGKLADPSNYFKQRGAKLLYKWDSKGVLSDELLLSGHVGAVLACVNHDKIDIFSLAIKNRVVSKILVHKTVNAGVTKMY